MTGILRKTILAVSVAGAFGVYIVWKRKSRIAKDPYKNFPDLSRHNNLLSACLTESIYAQYFNIATPNGVTLDQCIQSGVDNKGHPYCSTMGIVACDEESYEVFRDLFYPVIEARMGGYDPYTQLHVTDLDSTSILGGILDSDYVISTRIRTSRSVRGFRLPPVCNRAERREVECIVSNALKKLKGSVGGYYYSLSSLTPSEERQLTEDHFFIDKPVSPLLYSAGMARDWPDGRGVFHNARKNFLVWVNEEDHVRLISMQNGGDLEAVFNRLRHGLKQMESEMWKAGNEFMHSKNLGYIVTCPSNLGTGLKIGVNVKLPNLSNDPRFEKILRSFRLEKKVLSVSATNQGVVDISNLERIGKSEVQLVQLVASGISRLVDMEKLLALKGPITSLLPSGI